MFAERKISHSRVSEEEYTQTLFWGVRAGQHYQPRHIDLLTNLLKRDRLLFVRMLLSHLLLTSTQTNRENTKNSWDPAAATAAAPQWVAIFEGAIIIMTERKWKWERVFVEIVDKSSVRNQFEGTTIIISAKTITSTAAAEQIAAVCSSGGGNQRLESIGQLLPLNIQRWAAAVREMRVAKQTDAVLLAGHFTLISKSLFFLLIINQFTISDAESTQRHRYTVRLSL